MEELEHLGFLKIDFLGLKILTVANETVRLVSEKRNRTINLDAIPLDDDVTFKLLQAGDTLGIFQLKSEGIKELLRKLQPSVFEDIIAVCALYRPGPLGSGMVDDFIARKHGRQPIKYLLPELEPILKETYGVIVYQEQVMKIASTVAGYSLGEADILRRAMGKKKVEVMAQQRELFLSRAKERGTDEEKAGELFDLMAYFAGYGFNKSHSTASAILAYQTAYLKANYPAEFMASLISYESSTERASALQEARNINLNILPPAINKSCKHFEPLGDSLLFSLEGVDQVSEAAIKEILAARAERPFSSLENFCNRVNVDKQVVENLIKAGAFDDFDHRAQLIEEASILLRDSKQKKDARISGQTSMFEIPRVTPWSNTERLEHEEEVLSMYLTGDPLEPHKIASLSDLLEENEELSDEVYEERELNPDMTCCGILTRIEEKAVRKGKNKGKTWCTFYLTDTVGSINVKIFTSLFEKVGADLVKNKPYIVKGSLIQKGKQLSINAKKVIPLRELLEHARTITAEINGSINRNLIDQIKGAICEGNNSFKLQFKENNELLTLETKERVAINDNNIAALEELGVKIRLSL